jgi:hypothetical protein
LNAGNRIFTIPGQQRLRIFVSLIGFRHDGLLWFPWGSGRTP